MRMDPKEYERPLELFSVVLVKRSANEMSAKSDDFKRIEVQAADPVAAMLSDEVQKQKDFRPMCATKPGILTDPEIMARRRELDPTVDRSKL